EGGGRLGQVADVEIGRKDGRTEGRNVGAGGNGHGLYVRPRRMRVRVYQHPARLDLEVVGRDHVVEGRRRAARLGPVLVPVPRAGDAPVHDPPLTEGSILV